MKDIIYLDNNATTPLDPRVLETMMPYLTNLYGNAASNHAFGVEINQAVKKARTQLADLIGCEPYEIIFTSGATEAINLAIKGVAAKYKDKGNHIITVSTEHPAVLDTCKYLESKGMKVTYLPVNKGGLINLDDLKKAFKAETILTSVMYVNNETGVIQSIKEIADIAHENNAFFMTDATQAVGKMPVDVNELGIDIMAFSCHKFYGPKGIGALYIKSRRPNKVKLDSLIHGGGHEKGMRSGTLNVPGIVGFGKAAEIAQNEMYQNAEKIENLRNELEKKILSMEDTYVNGDIKKRLYNVSNICFKGIDADAIMTDLDGIMVSTGSACSSIKVEPSHVLIGMGIHDSDAYSSIRFSLGKMNNLEKIKIAVNKVKKVVEELRSIV